MMVLLLVSAAVSSVPSDGWTLSVEEAYRAIPHRRTMFDPAAAQMDAAERAFLVELFALVDRAVTARVEQLVALQARRAISDTAYDDILGGLKRLDIPPRLRHIQQLVVDAILEQRTFLAQWRAHVERGDRAAPAIAGDPLVDSSSQKLRAAYDELMALYPQEPPQNWKALFDYLCALDFV